MAKDEYVHFCGSCGFENKNEQKFCPNCGSCLYLGKNKKVAKYKVITGLLLLAGVLCLMIFTLSPPKKLGLDNGLEKVNYSCIHVEEMNSTMINQTEGYAQILIKLPDYRTIFLEAWETSNPERYINNTLKSGEYPVLEFEREVKITIENGEKKLHEELVVDQLLDELLIDAVNTVSEE